MVTRRFFKLFRHVILPVHASGRGNLRTGEPLIVVSNHVGSFGPICVMTSLPVPLFPWVAHDVTDFAAAADRIRAEFVEGELGLRPPLSRWISRVIARICVAIMRDLGAIPVYDRSRRIALTVSRSLGVLEQGRNLLVFPENAAVPVNDVLCDFCTGFIHIAKLYYEKTRRAVAFLPVAVNRRVQAIRVGSPIRFDGSAPFAAEKRRLKRELEGRIYRLYYDLELEGSALRRSSPA